MTAPELGDTTPIELDALVKEWRIDLDTVNLRFGMVCATLANCHRDPAKHEPYKPTDFFTTLAEDADEEPEDVDQNIVATLLDDWRQDIKQATKQKRGGKSWRKAAGTIY